MYLGSANAVGLFHVAAVFIDNCIEEAINGYATSLHLRLHPDGSLTCSDNGRGIPIEPIPALGNRPAVEVLLSHLFFGSRDGSDRKYKLHCSGMHAIRLGTVNPFAVRMQVEVRRDSGIWSVAFERGELVEPLCRIGNTADHGTTITFHPDPQIFGHATFNAIELREALRAIASCVPGLLVRFVDERTGRSDDFSDPRGPTALVEHLGSERPPLCETIRVCGERNGIRAVIAFRYYAIRNSQQRLYVNSRAVTRNRRILDSYMPSFHYALSAHARAHGLHVPTGANLNAGLVAVLSLWHPNPEFFDDCEYYRPVEDFEPSSLVVSTLHNELRTFWPARPDLARRLLSDLA